MRKTKIICTLGPATDQEGILEKLVEEGMNVARLNFSHGDFEEHGARMVRLRAARTKLHKPVAMLLDTKGPEIRIGDFADQKIQLIEGQAFTLTGREVLGDESIVSVLYPDLYQDVAAGSTILIDDGLVGMEVISIEGKDIHCVVKNDGVISNHKGVNVPDVHVNLPYLSEKDRSDILFGIENDVDYIAASFARCADDIKQIRQLLDDNDGKKIKIVAKIENGEGVEKIDEIIEVSDAIMIARGDMGVELPAEEVPVVQKMIIKKVYEAGKQVITATQMLDSMMKNPRPTRAEATDVANAIYDGTSAIMLSGETAAGKFPVEALQMMIRIAVRTEQDIDYQKRFFSHDRSANPDITDAISHATCTTAYDLGAGAIVTVTKSGRSAQMISRYRPTCEIIGCAVTEKVWRQLNLSWGVTPVLLDEKQDVFELFDHAIQIAKDEKLIETEEVVVITAGIPLGTSGTTNMIKVHVVE
jgi:pyruvate kinase